MKATSKRDTSSKTSICIVVACAGYKVVTLGKACRRGCEAAVTPEEQITRAVAYPRSSEADLNAHWLLRD